MDIFEEYAAWPFPDGPIEDMYKAVVNENRKGWTKTEVKVQRKTESGWEDVAEYQRNYSMLDTFKPFRQLRDGKWYDYALISPNYTTFSVMDLSNGEIIATRPDPVYNGEARPGAGFCPMSFQVFDWWDEYAEEDGSNSFLPTLLEEIEARSKAKAEKFGLDFDAVMKQEANFLQDELKEFSCYTGQWGLVSGCVWGDDSSEKVQYIDLSRISEGIVTTDERFGYIELTDKPLKESVFYHAEYGEDTLSIAIPVRFSIKSGEVKGAEYLKKNWNWGDKPES